MQMELEERLVDKRILSVHIDGRGVQLIVEGAGSIRFCPEN